LKQQPGYNEDFAYVIEADSEKLLSESPAAVCARLWPDSISTKEAAAELAFSPQVAQVNDIVARIKNEEVYQVV
jgi:hypothetical protein